MKQDPELLAAIDAWQEDEFLSADEQRALDAQRDADVKLTDRHDRIDDLAAMPDLKVLQIWLAIIDGGLDNSQDPADEEWAQDVYSELGTRQLPGWPRQHVADRIEQLQDEE